jgi:UrcA family protein
MYRKIIVATVTALLTATSTGPCAAQQRTRIVHYQDLDLANPAGAKTLRNRLDRAVNYVCRMPSPAGPLTGTEDQDCRVEVMAKVQPKMLVAIELAQTRAASQVAAR